jgi:argininosuccinate lyase
MRKLWGGAFRDDSSDLVDRFGQSIEDDLTFWREDVMGSLAHAQMLGETGVISVEDAGVICKGLEQILQDGPEKLPQDVEDIHTAVEMRLTELIGDAAGRLHTARSRNDQVATDARLWLRRRAGELQKQIKALQEALLAVADEHTQTTLPGVTHQQHAQPISLAFHHLAHFYALQRHGWRLERLLEIISTNPLGSAALAGTPHGINRWETTSLMGFRAPAINALDATSDRSFILDGLHICAMIMIDLSRLSQEIILWASPEFGFIKLSDTVTTGSSIMPQKRNPDMAELIRGRTGRAVGNWTALATTMKGLVLGYSRDTQEDKPPLFDSMQLAQDSLRLCTIMISTAEYQADQMANGSQGDFSTATDLADALAAAGMPFREAHEAVGKAVRTCLDRGIGLEDLTAADLQEICPGAPESALANLQPNASMNARTSQGGTGSIPVADQAKRAHDLHSSDGFIEIQ